jgi:hypothetical protein
MGGVWVARPDASWCVEARWDQVARAGRFRIIA